jgi:hypothetical protein
MSGNCATQLAVRRHLGMHVVDANGNRKKKKQRAAIDVLWRSSDCV